MSILRPKDNTQLRIALKYVSAKESKSKFGGAMEYLYTLATGDLIYISAQGHQEIQSLKPSPDEPFLLSKSVGKGNAVTWSVERISDPVPAMETGPHAIGTPNVQPVPQNITRAGIPIPPSLTTRESQRIFLQLVATIQAVSAAEEFSVSSGRPVSFGPEDIRAMGISGFIEQSRRAA